MYSIRDKFINCEKDITELIITHNGKHKSSLYFFGIIGNYEIYGYDFLLSIDRDAKTIIKNYHILIFNKESFDLGVVKIGSFSSAKEFKDYSNRKIEEIKQKRFNNGNKSSNNK